VLFRSVQSTFNGTLEKAGYTVEAAADAFQAVALLEEQVFNVAIVAVKLRGPSGFDLVRRIQEWQPECAVVMTSANPSREDLLEALRVRADDFLIEPVPSEILLRSVGEALLRHSVRQPMPPEVVVGALQIDTRRRAVYWHGQVLALTPTEYCALLALAQEAGQIISASRLVHRCRGYSVGEDDARQLIKPHIANVRQKLEQGGRYKRVLLNHRGRGFVLRVEEPPEGTSDEGQLP